MKVIFEVFVLFCFCEKESSYLLEENFDVNLFVCIFFMCVCVVYVKCENYMFVMCM